MNRTIYVSLILLILLIGLACSYVVPFWRAMRFIGGGL